MFQIDLVADTRPGRDCLEIGEGFRAPFQKVITLRIALIFDLHILFSCLRMTEFVDHYGVVDDQMHRNQWIDFLRVTAQLIHRIAHRRQIDHAWHTGKILQQHAGRAILDFAGGLGVLLPID